MIYVFLENLIKITIYLQFKKQMIIQQYQKYQSKLNEL